MCSGLGYAPLAISPVSCYGCPIVTYVGLEGWAAPDNHYIGVGSSFSLTKTNHNK